MGVPGLYRWLVERYPETVCSVAEYRSPYLKGPSIDTSAPNPNGVEFDNLYIDMNGLIHPCFHPQGLPAPQSYDDVFKFIFRYIERVFSIVRPRKLLFLAVDGVAPRAKMNHQRIRRLRVAKESAGKISAVEGDGIGKAEDDKKLDSNVITPGTEFMDLLSSALRYYVHWRMNVDSGWRRIKVILSDSTVVGEGEYKIMSYIRSQRNLPGYDPNTRHCLHGLDADLIMLALATHEIHFSILREVITNGQTGYVKSMRKHGYQKHRNQKHRNQKLLYPRLMREFLHSLEFEFFNLWVLREYLERELLPNVVAADFDRLIDDFVFICIFVGNDYLPHLPSLDIYKGGIELLLIVYQEEFVKMGHLTNAPKVNLKSMEHFLQALSSHENAISTKCFQMKRKRSTFQDSYNQPGFVELRSISVPYDDDVESTTNKIKIHEGYAKQKYYTGNFNCESHDIDRTKKDAVLKYTEGVCWLMHYYYQGVCSWQWFYPYHYAPFASDFCGLDKLEIHFTLGQPFKPLDQLLGVLPAASAQALPLFYRELMTNASSPILDFYPKEAKLFKNGKKHAWQCVYKLPFIDESRLLAETVKVEHTLTDEEKQRNRFGKDKLFINFSHPLARMIKNKPSSGPGSELQIQINPVLSGGMNGSLYISDEPVPPRFIPSHITDKPSLKKNNVIAVDYICPSHHHIPKLPFGVIMPPRILSHQDSPHPPDLQHATPSLSRSSITECPAKKSKKKKRKQDKVDVTVELGMAREQGGGKDWANDEAKDVKQNIKNGKSEAEVHLVERGETICGASKSLLVVEKSTNQIKYDLASAQQQQIMTGINEHGISKELQRDKLLDNKNNKTDENLMDGINIEIRLTPTNRTVSCIPSTKEHESVGGELTNKINCDSVVHAKGQEINFSGEHKRNEEKKREYSKHMLKADPVSAEGKVEKLIGADENMKAKKKLDLAIGPDGENEEKDRKQEVKGEEKGNNVKATTKSWDAPFNKDQEKEGTKVKKRKSKQETEIHIEESKSNSSKNVDEARGIRRNGLESASKQETENDGGGKEQRKRRWHGKGVEEEEKGKVCQYSNNEGEATAAAGGI